ncbi:unnamed protein product [Agarophyton chilense]
MQDRDDSEFQKMISGSLYEAACSGLDSLRAEARRLCREYNLDVGYSENPEKKREHLRKIFGACEKGAIVEPPIRVDYGINTEIGSNFYSNFDVVILDCAKVIIGNNVLVGPGVHIYTAMHPHDVKTRHYRNLEMAQPVTIGSNVWLGGKAIILPGVTIGEGSIIGAGSVVTKDIPPFSMAVGNPARVVKELE